MIKFIQWQYLSYHSLQTLTKCDRAADPNIRMSIIQTPSVYIQWWNFGQPRRDSAERSQCSTKQNWRHNQQWDYSPIANCSYVIRRLLTVVPSNSYRTVDNCYRKVDRSRSGTVDIHRLLPASRRRSGPARWLVAREITAHAHRRALTANYSLLRLWQATVHITTGSQSRDSRRRLNEDTVEFLLLNILRCLLFGWAITVLTTRAH